MAERKGKDWGKLAVVVKVDLMVYYSVELMVVE
jgi:hypothetical protein